jgi:hypothetical protein
LTAGPARTVKADVLRGEGLRLSLPPWGVQTWRVMHLR